MIWKFTCFLFKHHVKDGVGTFIAIRHNQCLPKNGIRPSKNRFDQTFWLAQARTLFEALRRIASLVCILTISSLYFFFCVKQKKRSCPMIDIFIKRLQKMCNKLKSRHQTGSKFKFTLVYKYFKGRSLHRNSNSTGTWQLAPAKWNWIYKYLAKIQY